MEPCEATQNSRTLVKKVYSLAEQAWARREAIARARRQLYSKLAALAAALDRRRGSSPQFGPWVINGLRSLRAVAVNVSFFFFFDRYDTGFNFAILVAFCDYSRVCTS